MKMTHLLTIKMVFALFLLGIQYAFTQNVNCSATTVEDFFQCYGGQNAFSGVSVASITAFIEAEDAIKAGDYTTAKSIVDNVFDMYPIGDNLWWGMMNSVNGANTGTPHAYYGLRMIQDIVDYHLSGSQNASPKTAFMKVVLVGCSEGIQPTTDAELQNGTGPFVTNSLQPKVREDDYHAVRQSLEFFSRYVTAITNGGLELQIDIVELPDLCLPMSVSSSAPYFAYTGSSIGLIWDALDDEMKNSTDWWWLVYPSHVPEASDFDDDAFITGGMGLDRKGGPAFIIDDKWITRKPAHLGQGDYSDIERRIYLPQWFQHEFFHHLYRAYPELALEVNGHDWFDRDFWPSDFVGQFEPDYYAESLHKRLQLNCASLTSKLITRIDNQAQEQFGALVMDELLGQYSLDQIQNDWHIGEIIQQGSQYFWRNNANVQWEVFPNLANGRLDTGSDSPYPGVDFSIQLYRTAQGDFVPGVEGLVFQGGLYRKRFGMMREIVPMEIAVGAYTHLPVESSLHTGNISKVSGQLYWENDAADQWSLVPNAQEETFELGSDSLTPNGSFELILTEDECDIYVLGFKYGNEYFWKSKRNLSNQSPGLINGIDDLELIQGFANYSIDVSNIFTDPENDELQFFASSTNPDLISTTINNQELILTGGDLGSSTIRLYAVDHNGGVSFLEFLVEVKESLSVSDHYSDADVVLFPSWTEDIINVSGELSEYHVSIYAMNGVLEEKIEFSGDLIQVDLSHLSSGMYFVRIENVQTGSQLFQKVIKY